MTNARDSADSIITEIFYNKVTAEQFSDLLKKAAELPEEERWLIACRLEKWFRDNIAQPNFPDRKEGFAPSSPAFPDPQDDSEHWFRLSILSGIFSQPDPGENWFKVDKRPQAQGSAQALIQVAGFVFDNKRESSSQFIKIFMAAAKSFPDKKSASPEDQIKLAFSVMSEAHKIREDAADFFLNIDGVDEIRVARQIKSALLLPEKTQIYIADRLEDKLMRAQQETKDEYKNDGNWGVTEPIHLVLFARFVVKVKKNEASAFAALCVSKAETLPDTLTFFEDCNACAHAVIDACLEAEELQQEHDKERMRAAAHSTTNAQANQDIAALKNLRPSKTPPKLSK